MVYEWPRDRSTAAMGWRGIPKAGFKWAGQRILPHGWPRSEAARPCAYRGWYSCSARHRRTRTWALPWARFWRAIALAVAEALTDLCRGATQPKSRDRVCTVLAACCVSDTRRGITAQAASRASILVITPELAGETFAQLAEKGPRGNSKSGPLPEKLLERVSQARLGCGMRDIDGADLAGYSAI